MKRNTLITILIIIALGLAVYVSFLSYQEKTKPVQQITNPTIKNTSQSNEQDSTNIHIFSPKSGDSIGLPLKILGEVRVFENQFIIRVKDKNGKILTEESAMGQDGDMGQYNLFEKEINYPDPKTTEGTIEVFDYSAKDGSEIDKVTIPIKFGYAANALNIQVFFSNSKKDPQMNDCQKVYPVYRRIAYTKETAKAAIEELLKGPTQDELDQGYFTSINQGTGLKSILFKNGVATADFDQTLEVNAGGSCKVVNIRSQIIQTLKQFSTIKSVIISINGKTEDILQP